MAENSAGLQYPSKVGDVTIKPGYRSDIGLTNSFGPMSNASPLYSQKKQSENNIL